MNRRLRPPVPVRIRAQGTQAAASLAPAQLARLRWLAYRLLGAVFHYPDDRRLVRVQALSRKLLQAGGPWAAFAFYLPWRRLLERLTALDVSSPAAVGRLQDEYVRLFLLQGEAPLHEAHYRDPTGQAAGLLMAAVARAYASAGLAPAGRSEHGPDSLVTELEFMACLCDQEHAAWQARHLAGVALSLQRQQSFLRRHLAGWVPLFARGVAGAAPGSLYAAAAVAVAAFVQHDQTLLGPMVGFVQACGLEKE